MCRNIRVLHNFEPPTTEEEIHDAALQFVRKVSGVRAPSAADRASFDDAVRDVAAATRRLLTSLTARAPLRTRDGEKERARARWTLRRERLTRSPG